MTTIQWRPAVNALTTPSSYKMIFLPRNVVDTPELAVRMAAELPNYSAEELRTILATRNKVVRQSLINGEQVTEENNFTYSLSFTARLESADDAPPPVDQCLHVRVHASPPFVAEVRHAAQLERLPAVKKLPLITAAEDTVLKLRDVLNPNGALRLTGSDLLFDQEAEDSGCELEGTRGGRKIQSRHTVVANAEITFLPDIPAQNDPWNNEYLLSVSTQYTEHGTLRTGIYERRLRTPLTVAKLGHPNPPEIGILTDKAAAPYVKITGGSLSADEAARIQVILEHDGSLSFNLADMSEGGRAGAAVKVTANGPLTLNGFSGSALTSLNLSVNNFADLVKMIRSHYSGRLVDVLELKTS